MVGILITAIFKRVLLNNGVSPFTLLTTSGVRKGMIADCSAWKTPDHIYNVYSDLINTIKPSPCSNTSCGRNGWGYAYFGDMDAVSAIMTNLLSRFTADVFFSPVLMSCRVILFFNPNIGACKTEFLPQPILHTQTPPTDSKIQILHKGALCGSILLSMLYYPVPPCNGTSTVSESSMFFSTPSLNKERASILQLSRAPPDPIPPPPPPPLNLLQNQTYLRSPLAQALNRVTKMQHSLFIFT